ncbi:hypothetical protein MBLNU459_g2523t1 [Dothideomycetes sp. NU459]
MLRLNLSKHVLGVLTLAVAQCAANLPYNPTQIVLSRSINESINDYAYIIQPNSGAYGQAQLLSLDLTQPLKASGLSTTTLYTTLPFLDLTVSKAYTPVSDQNGDLVVLAGKCSTDSGGPELWSFSPDAQAQYGNGTWTQGTLSLQENAGGLRYLGSAVSFSEPVGGNFSDTNLYIYGGMCPFDNTTDSTWTMEADYSNQMVNYAPGQDKSGKLGYEAAVMTSRGPPIPEAGFTMTGLPPSYGANISGTQSQAQSFVLVGGHTKNAFINMSQVALWSLPQESWAFVPVTQPSSANNVVEPRSGHTTILSEDKKSLVVFGGWVGDVSTPATPQLVILELGSGYGGAGDWKWTVPTQSGSSALASAGIYGHGAAMLPGDVMMVVGGYSISSSSSRLSRRATPTSNSQTLFYNVSSSSWLSSYNIPASATSTAMAESQRSGGLTTTSQKAGLGVGLTIGLLLFIGVLIFGLWYLRKVKRRRTARETDNERLMRNSQNFDTTYSGAAGIDGRGGDASAGALWDEKAKAPKGAYSWLPQDLPDAHHMDESRHDVDRTGILINNPSPTRGLRKNPVQRNNYQYHAAPRYDDGRLSRGSGNIHPIEERDEEEDRGLAMGSNGRMSPAQRQLKALEGILSEKRASDPFRDSMAIDKPDPLGSHPVSPEIGSGEVKRAATNASSGTSATDQVSSWIREWTASYAASVRPSTDYHTTRSGRNSPTKTDERTSSSLSEQSNRSGISSRSVARTSSTRSGLFFGLSGAPSISPSPTDERFQLSPTTGRSKSPFLLPTDGQSRGGRPGMPRNHTAESSSTVATTWGQLMAEGEALLGSSTQPAPLNYPKRAKPAVSDGDLIANAGPAPPIPPRRRLGWMGSLRRVLGTDRSFSASQVPNNKPPMVTIPDRRPAIPPQQYYDRSNSSSPTKRYSRGGASSSMSNGPRRTASDSSEFLRYKRGKRDWEHTDEEPQDVRWSPYRDEPDAGDWGDVPDIQVQKHQEPVRMEESAEDWDVEQAAAKRDIQVMFTVPKARLRVVNADVDQASMRSVSEGAISTRKISIGNVEEQQSKDSSDAESFATARAHGDDAYRSSAETQRKLNNYGIEIMDWERHGLESRDRDGHITRSRKNSKVD